jgi:hypothetical protein
MSYFFFLRVFLVRPVCKYWSFLTVSSADVKAIYISAILLSSDGRKYISVVSNSASEHNALFICLWKWTWYCINCAEDTNVLGLREGIWDVMGVEFVVFRTMKYWLVNAKRNAVETRLYSAGAWFMYQPKLPLMFEYSCSFCSFCWRVSRPAANWSWPPHINTRPAFTVTSHSTLCYPAVWYVVLK